MRKIDDFDDIGAEYPDSTVTPTPTPTPPESAKEAESDKSWHTFVIIGLIISGIVLYNLN